MASPSVDPVTLELYKMAVEMADRTSARRLATNTFFVTLHSAIAALVGIIATVHVSKSKTYDATSLITLAAVGFVLSITWWGLLRYYRRLNHAKFEVINSMETLFPVRPFTDEWASLHPVVPAATGRFRIWIRAHKHREASLVEQIVPLVFGAIYVVLAVRVAIT